MDYLKKHLREKVDLTDSELDKITSIFTKKSYRKGEELLSMGDSSSKFYYVSSGILRTYSIDTTGHEQTWALHINNSKFQIDSFAGDFSQYYYNLDSEIFIEAYTDAIVYEANFKILDKIYESSFNFTKLGLKIHQEQSALLVKRIKIFKNLTAKEKYLLMKNLSPLYEKILTNYQFATIIGIAPQSLSRIKKEIIKTPKPPTLPLAYCQPIPKTKP